MDWVGLVYRRPGGNHKQGAEDGSPDAAIALGANDHPALFASIRASQPTPLTMIVAAAAGALENSAVVYKPVVAVQWTSEGGQEMGTGMR